MHRETRPYFTKPIERLSLPQQYFAALLLAFKLFAAAMIVLCVIWEIKLPSEPPTKSNDFDLVWLPAQVDYYAAASLMNHLCLIAAGVILVGGLFQLLKHSRRAGKWSISFGCLILTIGLIYASHISSLWTAVLNSLSALC
jgi:hypothetical protein